MPAEQRSFGPIVPSLIATYRNIDPGSVEEPPDAVDEARDVSVGVMNENHRRIYGLYRASRDETLRKIEEHMVHDLRDMFRSSDDRTAHAAIIYEAKDAAARFEIVSKLLIAELKRSFPDLQDKDDDRVGVRAGFVVVYNKQSGSREDEVADLITDLISRAMVSRRSR